MYWFSLLFLLLSINTSCVSSITDEHEEPCETNYDSCIIESNSLSSAYHCIEIHKCCKKNPKIDCDTDHIKVLDEAKFDAFKRMMAKHSKAYSQLHKTLKKIWSQ